MSKELKLNLNIAGLFVQCITLGHLVFDICTCNLLTDNNTADDANVLVKSHEKLRRGLSKLFLNYSMKTNAVKRCLTNS